MYLLIQQKSSRTWNAMTALKTKCVPSIVHQNLKEVFWVCFSETSTQGQKQRFNRMYCDLPVWYIMIISVQNNIVKNNTAHSSMQKDTIFAVYD